MGKIIDSLMGKESKIHDEKSKLTGEVLQKQVAADRLRRKAEQSLKKLEEIVAYRIYLTAGGKVR